MSLWPLRDYRDTGMKVEQSWQCFCHLVEIWQCLETPLVVATVLGVGGAMVSIEQRSSVLVHFHCYNRIAVNLRVSYETS